MVPGGDVAPGGTPGSGYPVAAIAPTMVPGGDVAPGGTPGSGYPGGAPGGGVAGGGYPGGPSGGGVAGGGYPGGPSGGGVAGGGYPGGPSGGGVAGGGQPAAMHPAAMQSAPLAPAPLVPVTPVAVKPIPSATPPYLASQTAARSGRPIEPWKDSLRLMMFLWGGLLLAAFATPVSLDPLAFNWDAILHAEGTAKLPPLIMAAVGLLSIVVAAIPMTPSPRGMIAALLGLAGVFVPVMLHGMPPWQLIVSMIGIIVLVPSLLVRQEYRDAALPKILITLGASAALLPMVIPVHGAVPLVELFKAAIDAPGATKIILILILAQVALLVLSLLAWLPAPASGGAKPIAWLLMLWPLFVHAAMLFLVGDPDMVTKTPFAGAMSWVAGGTGMGGGDAAALTMMMAGAGIGVAYLAIIGYGGATVIGKNLE